MNVPSPRPLFRVVALAVALTGASPSPALAQTEPARTGPVGGCEQTLAVAADHYANQRFDEVEPLVLDCVYRPTATAADVQRAYRLLALTFIKQDLLTDAQLTIVKLLGVDYAYRADPLTDPPFYVALVGAVKDQLRVDAGPTPADNGPVVDAQNDGEAVILVNLNTATAEELDEVPGIGPSRAAAIIAYRRQNGPFGSVRELEGVSGIGPRNIEPMLPHLTVSGRTVVTIAGGGVPATEPPEPSPEIETATVATVVNLNTATAEELDTLDGIGPALAARIIAYRTEYGPFRTVEDVTRVSGIGPAKLAGFADRVTVE